MPSVAGWSLVPLPPAKTIPFMTGRLIRRVAALRDRWSYLGSENGRPNQSRLRSQSLPRFLRIRRARPLNLLRHEPLPRLTEALALINVLSNRLPPLFIRQIPI